MQQNKEMKSENNKIRNGDIRVPFNVHANFLHVFACTLNGTPTTLSFSQKRQGMMLELSPIVWKNTMTGMGRALIEPNQVFSSLSTHWLKIEEQLSFNLE